MLVFLLADKKQLSITLDEEVVEKLDEERGSFARSSYINEILRRKFLD